MDGRNVPTDIDFVLFSLPGARTCSVFCFENLKLMQISSQIQWTVQAINLIFMEGVVRR